MLTERESRAAAWPAPLSWIVAVMLALVLPLSFVAAGASVLPGDVAISRAVQGNLPGILDPLIVAANTLGSTPSMLAIAAVVALGLFLKGYRQPGAVVVAATLAQAANVALKLTLESPRPTSSLVHVSEQTTGYGFPSGHTMGTTVMAFILVYVASTTMAAGFRRRSVQAGLLLMPLLVGVSRIETGAHWPSDVLGAWLWGALVGIAIITLSRPSWSAVRFPAIRSSRPVSSSIAIGDLSGD
ncbi:MAG TPA: phosphatase PAP2 family protein [Thermomicrobiales bacterium]|nr:phosphatase PAP2 family protein [Thermomicrobiales bacterium]